MLKAFDANDGRLLFKQRLAYEESVTPDQYGSAVTETVVYDYTILRPHPQRTMFLTSSMSL